MYFQLMPRKQLHLVLLENSSLCDFHTCPSPWGSGALHWECWVEFSKAPGWGNPLPSTLTRVQGHPNDLLLCRTRGRREPTLDRAQFPSHWEAGRWTPSFEFTHCVLLYMEETNESPHSQPVFFNHWHSVARIKLEIYKLPILNCVNTRNVQTRLFCLSPHG